jgi:hypothetical protein
MTDRLAILEEMDNFNTAPIEQSGSIMEGILNEQTSLNPDTSAPQEQPIVEPKKELPNDYLPLNSSIQELTKLVSDKFNNYDRRFTELSNTFDTVRQPVQQPQPSMQYDPDAPVTMQHLSQVIQAYSGINQQSNEAFRNSILTRAQIEYMRYKQENPSFDLDPREVEATVNQAFKSGQTDLVKNANWRGYFDQMYRPTLDTKLTASEKRVAELERELETMKKKPVATTTTPVTPAVGKTTSRPSAIESPVGNTIDVTSWKSFNKKGDFKSFGKELKPKFGISP